VNHNSTILLAFSVGAFLALLPERAASVGRVNNDVLVELFAATFIWLCTVTVLRRLSVRRSLHPSGRWPQLRLSRRNDRSLDRLVLGDEYGHLRELPAFRNRALRPARAAAGAHPDAPRRPRPQVPVLSARTPERSGHPGASTPAVAKARARDIGEPVGRARRGGRNPLRRRLVARAAGGEGELALAQLIPTGSAIRASYSPDISLS